ncbi:hypothetical protein GLOIN_2v1509908 [Rhizophagus irregularis DAOM 181602=DAOM 197198]|nr:hypothetical protein GLOIN_2v1509908 [Rhizophagus irregularis DAOM 181602=DAOM 197198]
METKMQNSIRYSTVLTIIEISDHVEIGKLIGRKGRNLKPIEKGTEMKIFRLGSGSIKYIEKEKNNSRISDNGNHQHATVATPRNHKDNDQKEKRKMSKRKMSHTTKTRQSRNKENIRRNDPANHTNYNQSN